MAELDMRLRDARENSLRKCQTQVITLTATVKNGNICTLDASTLEKNIFMPDNIDTDKPIR